MRLCERALQPTRRHVLGCIIVCAVLVAGCGDDAGFDVAPLGSPQGDPLMPDLVPAPPIDVHTRFDATTGEWTLRFSSTLANAGDGPFILHAARPAIDSAWIVEQEIAHDVGGALAEIPATITWGGDGHHHFHVAGVATYWLGAIVADEELPEASSALTDTKVGFCFFDSGRALERLGPDDAAYHHESCGELEDLRLAMGLSPGWHDEYTFALPGQSISVAGIDDGEYRLWGAADPAALFVEADETNNRTWVDLRLTTNEQGLRIAEVIAVGPGPI